MTGIPSVFDELGIVREAQREPRRYDPDELKTEISVHADEVASQLGRRVPAPIPGEGKALHVAKIGELLAEFGPVERRSIDRRSLPFRDVCEVVRADLEFARAEVERPHHSLKDGEVREVTKLDDAGRPMTEWHTRTEGCRWWMNDFAGPLRYVSGGTNGIATPRSPRPSGYTFGKETPEARALELKFFEREHADSVAARAAAGLPRLSLDDWRRLS
jgi:hypothetical protein